VRALSWAPDNNVVAVFEGHGAPPGRFILYDVDKKEVNQEQILGTGACPVTDEYKSFMGSYLECTTSGCKEEGGGTGFGRWWDRDV